LYYVMPLVTGETLRARLDRERQLPIDDAVLIAREVADALGYAHSLGVIHRDIKPENILLQNGHALVADFGIALAVQTAGGARMTQTGLSLGTPQYMSPEQAMGERTIDARSDIYALGAVTYEMLVGEAPFTGPSVQAIVARVLTEAPRSIAVQRKAVSLDVEHAVLRGLEKLPADRFASAAEFAAALTTTTLSLSRAGVGASAVASAPKHRLVRALAWGVPTVIAVLLAAALWRQRQVTSASAAVNGPFQFVIEIEGDLTGEPNVAITADGSRMIFMASVAGRSSVFTQRLGDLRATMIAGSEGGLRPFLSPDGKWVGLARDGIMQKISIEGRTPIDLRVRYWGGGDWAPDGRIVYAKAYDSGLWETDEDGSRETMLTAPDSVNGELGHWDAQQLPDGDHVLFTSYRGGDGINSTIEVYSRKTRARTVLVRNARSGRFVASGHLVFTKGETLFAMAFDPTTLTVSGRAEVVVPDVAITHGTGYAAFAVSHSGTLVTMPVASYSRSYEMVLADRRGVARTAVPKVGRFSYPRLSPNKSQIAVALLEGGAAPDIWVYPVGSANGARLSESPGYEGDPAWTPDGRSVMYISERPLFELWQRAADVSGPEEVVAKGGFDRIAPRITPDGVIAYIGNPDGASDIRALTTRGGRRDSLFLHSTTASLSKPTLSPDGAWMAYESGRLGEIDVNIQSYPDPSRGRFKVSTRGGSEPLWTKGGRELVFRQADSVFAVAISSDGPQPGTTRLLFAGPYAYSRSAAFGSVYDVSADGETFLLLRAQTDRTRRQLVVTLNWFDELRAKVKK